LARTHPADIHKRELTLSTTRFSSDTTGDDKWTAGLFARDRDRRL
jgi:hypothetical protein